jgi:UDPglucose 6-dehydrogenase
VEEALDGADAAILVTEWPEFAGLDWKALGRRMSHAILVDGRNFLDPERMREAGFAYEGIGRSEPPEPATGRATRGGEPLETRPG